MVAGTSQADELLFTNGFTNLLLAFAQSVNRHQLHANEKLLLLLL